MSYNSGKHVSSTPHQRRRGSQTGQRAGSQTGQRAAPARRNSYVSRRRSTPPAIPVAAAGGAFDLKQFLFSLNGRLSASAFIVAVMVHLVCVSLSFFVILPICAVFPNFVKTLVVTVFLVAFVWSYAAFSVRRLHDLGNSGWWTLLWIVPLLNAFLAIYLAFWKGQPHENRHGQPAPAAPLLFAVVCYPLYTLIALINLVPVASHIPGINKVPGIGYVTWQDDIFKAQDVDQFIENAPGIMREGIGEHGGSLGLILSQGQMLAPGVFISDNRLLVTDSHLVTKVQQALARQQKLVVKNAEDEQAHVTRLVVQPPEKRNYHIYEIDRAIGKPIPMTEQERSDLAAMGAFN